MLQNFKHLVGLQEDDILEVLHKIKTGDLVVSKSNLQT